MIIKSINQSDFIDAFKAWDTYKDKYSYNALMAMYDYFQELSVDMGEPFELDVVAIACDYSEYSTAYEAMEQYQGEDMPIVDEEGIDLLELATKQEELAFAWLEERTTVINFDGGIIIQNF